MNKLMKSFGLFADEDGYWFVTEEDHDRGNFLVITYPDRIIVHKTIKTRLLQETKEKLTEIRLKKMQRDFK